MYTALVVVRAWKRRLAKPVTVAAHEVGTALELESRWADFRRAEDAEPWEREALATASRHGSVHTLRQTLSRIHEDPEWDRITKVHIGATFVQLLLDTAVLDVPYAAAKEELAKEYVFERVASLSSSEGTTSHAM